MSAVFHLIAFLSSEDGLAQRRTDSEPALFRIVAALRQPPRNPLVIVGKHQHHLIAETDPCCASKGVGFVIPKVAEINSSLLRRDWLRLRFNRSVLRESPR